jgi:hypothetical protein
LAQQTRDRIFTALSEAIDLSALLTACAVITVMPTPIVMMPNPRALDDWPEHGDRGVHYVRPLNLGRTIAIIIVGAVAGGAAIPLGRNKTAKEKEQFLFHIFSISPSCRKRRLAVSHKQSAAAPGMLNYAKPCGIELPVLLLNRSRIANAGYLILDENLASSI